MTIRRGEDWGVSGPLAATGVVVDSDAGARSVVAEHRAAGVPVPPIGLVGGDLWKALGAPRGGVERLHGPDARILPLDLGVAALDGRQDWFVTHLVARRSWWWGRVVAAMNGEWLGDWRVVPRAHPNDGVLEVVDGDPPLGQRWLARRRLRTGDHLPHPELSVSRATEIVFRFEQPTRVYLDGVDAGSAVELEVRVEPDALTVVV